MKSIFLILALLFTSTLFGQETIFEDDFEIINSNWSVTGNTATNDWFIDQCAGNGVTLPGTNAMYISDGSSGCGTTGNEQYAYSNSAGGQESLINYIPISIGCFESLELTFDYKIDGITSNSTGEVVYSIDNGSTWQATTGLLANSAAWTTTTIPLGSIPQFSNLLLGFQFTYDNSAISGTPLAIDNVVLTGADVTSPSIICPSPVTLYVTDNCDVSLMDYTSLANANDNCLGAVTVSQSPIPGTLLNVTESPTIILTARDVAGNENTCQFTQTVIDTISPSINCPGTQTTNMNASCEATVGDYISLATASDNCELFASITITQAPPMNAIIGADAIVTLTAEDGYGNTQSCNFTLQTIDLIDPTISCPASLNKNTDNGCTYSLEDLSNLVTVDDNCTQINALNISQSPVIGTDLPIGANQITINVEDANGNTNSCNFELTVLDQENPVVSCPSNQDVIVNENCSGTLLDYTSLVAASDNCSSLNNLQITQSPLAGTVISNNTLIDILVIDESGNSETCQFTAVLKDTIVPEINCPADFTMNINSSCEYIIPDLTGSVSGTDNCSALVDMSITQNPASGTTGNGVTNILLTLFDEQGNLNTCITKITPIDNTAPTVTCPTPPQVDNGVDCDYTLPYYGTSTLVLDNCPDYSITQSPAQGTIVNPGITEITMTVTDAGGNETSCSFNLSVIEQESPSITCPNNVSTCDPIVTFDAPIYADNCFSYIFRSDNTGLNSGDAFPVGTTVIEYTVADSSANTQTCTFSIEILDYPSPASILLDTLRLCDQTSTLLEADPITGGTGLWTLVSGQGNFNNQFASSTGVNNIAYGENVYAWTVSTNSCGSNSDTIVVISSQQPLAASIPFDTLFPCSNSTLDLVANTPTNGTGLWTTNSSAQIANASSNLTTATLNSSGISYFVWTVSNESCPTTRDTMYVVSNLAPQIITSDTAICIEDDILMIEGQQAVNGASTYWFTNDSDINIEDPNNPITNITNLSVGENSITYSSQFIGCPEAQSSLIIIASLCNDFEPQLPTIITPNFDGKNDLFIIDHLEKVYPNCEVIIFNRWGSIVFESIGYADPWDGTRNGEALPMGTYFYKIKLNDEENTIINGDISIIH